MGTESVHRNRHAHHDLLHVRTKRPLALAISRSSLLGHDRVELVQKIVPASAMERECGAGFFRADPLPLGVTNGVHEESVDVEGYKIG